MTAREELERRVDDAKVAYRAGVSAARTARGGRHPDGGPRLGRVGDEAAATGPDTEVVVTELATEDAAGGAL